MASRILIIDTSDPQRDSLIEGFNSRGTAAQNVLVRNDQDGLTVYPVIRSKDSSRFYDPDLTVTAAGLKLGIGEPDQKPTDGTWDFISGVNTSTDIAFDVSAATLQTTLNANASISGAGGVTVTLIGTGVYEVTFTTTGSKSSVGRAGDPLKLFPESNVNVYTSQTGATGVREKFVIEIVCRPDAYVGDWEALDEKGVTITTMRAGAVDAKAMFAIALAGFPYMGSFTFKDSAPISFNSNAENFAAAFPGWTVLATGDSAWTIENETEEEYTLVEGDFDLTNIFVYQGFSSTLPLNSSALFKRFLAVDAETISEPMQIKHLNTTLFKGDVTLTKDILSQGATGPSDFNQNYVYQTSDGDVTISRNLTINGKIDVRSSFLELLGEGDITVFQVQSDGVVSAFGSLSCVAQLMIAPADPLDCSFYFTNDGDTLTLTPTVSGVPQPHLLFTNTGSLYVPGLLQAGSNTFGAANTIAITGTAIVFEGSSVDASETSIVATNPTADRTITIPDATGTLALLSTAQTFTAPQALAGVTDGSSASAGYVGEEIVSTVLLASNVSLTTNTSTNVTSITLTPGDWDISAIIYATCGGATLTLLHGSWNETSATDSTVAGKFAINGYSLTGFSSGVTASISPTRKSVTTNTTIYLVAKAVFSAGSVGAYGILRARRVR